MPREAEGTVLSGNWILETGYWKLIALIVAGGTLIAVGLVSPDALRVVLTDGLVSLVILAAATGLGLWLIRPIGLHRAELRWQLLAAVGLGLGAIALLVLGLGLLGVLSRPLWIALLTLFALAGAVRGRHLRGERGRAPPDLSDTGSRWADWLWLLAIGFAALALLGGTIPPGILWPAEGNGYDVLEYHLGAPRDYFDAECITYLPHNIYSNFPFNVEMLYLLSMVLHGDPIGAVFTAKLLNVFLAAWAVAAVWLAGREFGPGSGTVAGLLAATCPFLVYLSGMAYVENGLVACAAMALAAMLRAVGDAQRATRWMLLSGLFAGLACGCKYTAMTAVAGPLAVAAVLLALRRRPGRLRLPIVFCAGCLVAFAPWLIKNAVATGNPIFPLAYERLGAEDGIWNEDGAARWHEGHLPAPEFRSAGARLRRLWEQVIGSRFYGPVIGLGLVFGGLAGVASIRNLKRPSQAHAASGADARSAAADAAWRLVPCWLMLLIGGSAWLAFTHLVDRFAIVLLVPCAVLAGSAWALARTTRARALGLAILVAAAGWNLTTTWRFFRGPPVSFLQLGLFGNTDLMTHGPPLGPPHLPRLNEILERGERILVVADARRLYLRPGADTCVVFNRNPFAEAAEARCPAGLIDWLRARGYAFVYVDWSEMRRLRGSRYGFWSSLTPDLFARLARAGLRPIENFSFEPGAPPYATLFAVPKDARDR